MLDKERIKYNFSRSARNYDDVAGLQKGMADHLFEIIKECRAGKILDIGCGTGYLTKRLAEKFSAAQVVGIDIAPGMIDVANNSCALSNVQFQVEDGEALSFGNNSFDLVVSSSSLHWMDAEKVVAEVARVLAAGGRFCFSTFGPETLVELKRAGLSVNGFLSVIEWKQILVQFFKTAEVEGNIISQKYKDVFELLDYLRDLGARVSGVRKAKGLMTKNKLLALLPGSASDFNVSFELIVGQAVL